MQCGRGVSLQLPRTNNAGTPSYTDGRWWWQALDPDRPEFSQRRGEVEHYSCERAASGQAFPLASRGGETTLKQELIDARPHL